MLTSLAAAILTVFLILTSAIIMPIYGQAEQYTQQLGDPQKFLVQKERTINDVRQSRLLLLEGINNAIERLKSEQTQKPIQGPSADITHIAQLLKTDQLGTAIVELNKLKEEVIKAFGQEAANKQVVPQIENLIAALEKQEPSPP
ncbi:MAG TPA: hypothetical protein VI278_17230 [Nitrososphaeraceae archaeon]